MRPLIALFFVFVGYSQLTAQTFNARPGGTQKPVLHGRHWMSEDRKSVV